MIKKIIIFITGFILSLLVLVNFVFANTIDNKTIKKVVSIVYDDSGSMLNSNEDWAYASYSLQNLIGLMNSYDELSVVKMSNPAQTIDINLSNNEERINDIKSIETWKENGQTPFLAVDTAVNWLKNKKSSYVNSQSTEFWLVVITDGGFISGYPSNMKDYLNNIKNSMGNSKFEGVFVAIGNQVPNQVKNDWTSVTGNHLITSKNSNDIINAMSEVSGLILGQGSNTSFINPVVSSTGNEITFETPFPLRKFIIYEQNQNVSLKEIISSEIKTNISAEFQTNKPGVGVINSKIIHCEASNEFIPAGEITLKFDNKIDVSNSKFKILAIPAVEVDLKILDKTGNVIEDINKISFTSGDLVEFAATVTSSIDNSIIDLRDFYGELSSELVVNNKNIKMKYNLQDNTFYGTYKIEDGSNLAYTTVTLPGYFRAKSDIINIYPREVINSAKATVSGNTINVLYKYTDEYEELATFKYTVTGGNINGICDFHFKNIPKGIKVSVNGIYANQNGKLSLKIYNDVPVDVKFYRNKDYMEIEKSKILIDVTSEQYELKWTTDSITEIILNPVKRKIVIEDIKLDNEFNINNFHKKEIYILSILGDNEYLSKEELETIKLDNSKIKGITFDKEVIEYNGRYALRIKCKKKLPGIFIQTGNIESNIKIETIYGEIGNKDISFYLKNSFMKYIMPMLLLLMIITIIGYIPGIKKKIYNKKYHIQLNGEDEIIYIKKITRLLPYISEIGTSAGLTLNASSNKNKIIVINNFDSSQKIYIDEELIEDGRLKLELMIDSKLIIEDGNRRDNYIYCNSLDDINNNSSFGLIDDDYDMFNSNIENNYEDDFF